MNHVLMWFLIPHFLFLSCINDIINRVFLSEKHPNKLILSQLYAFTVLGTKVRAQSYFLMQLSHLINRWWNKSSASKYENLFSSSSKKQSGSYLSQMLKYVFKHNRISQLWYPTNIKITKDCIDYYKLKLSLTSRGA